MKNGMDKNTYYLDFTTLQFLGGKELLKSMPVFFNRIYFCKKYANALWYGEKEEHFSNIAMLCREEDLPSLRQIIKNNFLYLTGWDSINYCTTGDYGFSFIGGNIKYILMPFKETETGYEIKSYNSDTYECATTTIDTSKEFFLDSSINPNGEFVRTCGFDLEDMTDANTVKKIAEKKAEQTAVYNNSGFAFINTTLFTIFISMTFAWISYLVLSYFLP